MKASDGTIDYAGFEVLRKVLTRYVREHMSTFGRTIQVAHLTVCVDTHANRLCVSTETWSVWILGAIDTATNRAPIRFTGDRRVFERDLFALKLAL